MQGGKSSSSVEAAKEAAANVGASAWAGKEKTKAVVQGTVDKMTAHDPVAKEAAEARKLERIHEVEAQKRDAMRHNAVAKERATAAAYHPTVVAGPRAVASDRATAPGANGAAGAVESGVPIAAAEAGTAQPARTLHDVPRAGSDDHLPARGAAEGDDYLPARGTAGGRSA